MSDAAAVPPPECAPSRAASLLALLQKLIIYGQQLAASLRERGADAFLSYHSRFDTDDIALILDRIARGLNLALGLQLRITQRPPPATPTPPRKRAPRLPRAPALPHPEEEPAACLAALPTPEELAVQLRRRPIGAVLADICRDLGIMPGHRLWQELRLAIMHHRGSVIRLMLEMLDRGSIAVGKAWGAMLAAIPPPPPPALATHPP